MAIPLFAYGKALHLKGKHDEAIEIFKEALTVLPQSRQNRPSVEADIRVHLSVCEYVNGDESALQRAEDAIRQIENSDEQKYEKDVWVCGGYMKLAEALSLSNKEAYEYLQKAREIIDANPDLKLRRKQLEKLEEKLR